MSHDDRGEPFLARWSRLKRERKSGGSGEAPPSAGATAPDAEAKPDAAPAPGPEAEPLDPAELPRLEDLTADSDLSRFLDPRIPSELRNAAIKRMWSLDPTIRDFIEVAEWQWDWNTPGGTPGYGPLEPGTDVASLVAQATGALNALGKGSEGGDSHENVSGQEPAASAAVAGMPDACAAQGGDLPDAAATVDPRSTAQPGATPPLPVSGQTVSLQRNEHAAAQQISTAQEPVPTANRRRHGGALPL